MQESTPFQNPAKSSPWSNYVKEFTMIFLAITLGFFVENFRENQQEKDQAKELAHRFFRELVQDSVTLAKAIDNRKLNNRSLQFLEDSFSISMLQYPSRNFTMHLVKTFYTYGRGSFDPKKVILDQVRLKGSEQFFHNGNIQQLTGELAAIIKIIEERNEIEYTYFRENMRPFMLRHFEAKWLSHIRIDDPLRRVDKLEAYCKSPGFEPPKFRNVDQLNIPDLVNMLAYRKEMSYNTMFGNYGKYETISDQLRKELQNEYQIKD